MERSLHSMLGQHCIAQNPKFSSHHFRHFTLWFLSLHHQVEMRSRPLCAKYHPKDCWYRPTDPGKPAEVPLCMAGHKCNFDLNERLACPFWESGTFSIGDSKVCFVLAIMDSCSS